MIQSKSEQQLALFQTPFEQSLDVNNRWVRLAHMIPWDKLARCYYQNMDADQGTPAKDARLILGAVIIKHKENFTDEDTIEMIKENVYMQYFVGLSSFTSEKIFEPSLFVAIRKRLGTTFWNLLNEIIIASAEDRTGTALARVDENDHDHENGASSVIEQETESKNRGELLLDATIAEQDIAYPNDLDLVNSSRMKADELITIICIETLQPKPRTYNRVARKYYLNTAKKKNRSSKEIHKAIGKQLRYLKRNISHLDKLTATLNKKEFEKIYKPRNLQYHQTIKQVYEQQKQMHDTKTHRVENRIVNIHQPHVRPMVRGKAGSNVEFGSKIDVSLHNGFARIERLDWNNYHEAETLSRAAENYKTHYGYYPGKIIVDRKYCTRENRNWCKLHGIYLSGKPLGRPTPQTIQQLEQLKKDSASRNAIEGKFGQGKRAYGLDYIKAKLQSTSESWIGSIVFVLNLVRWEQLFLFILFLLNYHSYSPVLNRQHNLKKKYRATF